MTKQLKIVFSFLLISSILCLTSCSSFNNVYRRPVYEAAAEGTAKGALAGAGIGAFLHTHLAGPAIAGSVIGLYSKVAPASVINRLHEQRINVFVIGDILEIVIPSDRIFHPMDTQIRRDCFGILNDVAILLEGWSDQPIEVEGLNDDLSSIGESIVRAELHARSLAAYLSDAGVPRTRMHVVSHGDMLRYADLVTASGRADNRIITLTTIRKPLLS